MLIVSRDFFLRQHDLRGDVFPCHWMCTQSVETMRREFRDTYMRTPLEAVEVVVPKCMPADALVTPSDTMQDVEQGGAGKGRMLSTGTLTRALVAS